MLQHEITTDSMTGILNKAGSVKALEKACAEETGVLMMIDLDSFKLADKALYVVKQNGKHGCSFYERSAGGNAGEGTMPKDLSQILQIIGERNEGKGSFSLSFD